MPISESLLNSERLKCVCWSAGGVGGGGGGGLKTKKM